MSDTLKPAVPRSHLVSGISEEIAASKVAAPSDLPKISASMLAPFAIALSTAASRSSPSSRAVSDLVERNLYTDGLTEARHDGEMFGLNGVSAALGGLDRPSPSEAVAVLRARLADFAYGALTKDICLLAARIT